MMPAIAVIMPVHNRADALARAIGSVIQQTYRGFELIIVDDGSTDGSLAVARSFDDDRIRIISFEKNRGANAARNEGVRAAKASLIAFLDSDDVYLPAKLATVTEEFKREPGLELLVDSFVKIQPPRSFVRRVIRKNPRIVDQRLFQKALFTRQLWKATPSITVRRELVERAGMFDETLRRMQDFDFLARASAVARCASIPDVLWVKHWDANSISAQDSLIPANIEIARRYPQQLRQPEYRPGLAYALRLSLWRRLLSGHASGAVRDVRQLARAFGRWEAARLLLGAMWPRPSLGR